MKLSLCRSKPEQTCTPGDLYVNGVWECYTLEDVIREVPGVPVAEWKIHGKTAIPEGVYRVTLEDSSRFGPETITINNVPGFTSIRMHAGNTDADTDGCPLVGQARGHESLLRSRAALEALKPKIRSALYGGGEVTISVENP